MPSVRLQRPVSANEEAKSADRVTSSQKWRHGCTARAAQHNATLVTVARICPSSAIFWHPPLVTDKVCCGIKIAGFRQQPQVNFGIECFLGADDCQAAWSKQKVEKGAKGRRKLKKQRGASGEAEETESRESRAKEPPNTGCDGLLPRLLLPRRDDALHKLFVLFRIVLGLNEVALRIAFATLQRRYHRLGWTPVQAQGQRQVGARRSAGHPAQRAVAGTAGRPPAVRTCSLSSSPFARYALKSSGRACTQGRSVGRAFAARSAQAATQGPRLPRQAWFHCTTAAVSHLQSTH